MELEIDLEYFGMKFLHLTNMTIVLDGCNFQNHDHNCITIQDVKDSNGYIGRIEKDNIQYGLNLFFRSIGISRLISKMAEKDIFFQKCLFRDGEFADIEKFEIIEFFNIINIYYRTKVTLPL